MKLVLVGVNHAHQIHSTWNDNEGFRRYLAERCQQQPFDLLAEELNEEAVRSWGGTGSVLRMLAGDLGIDHAFVDPTTAERAELGIPSQGEIIETLKRVYKIAEESRIEAEERKFWAIREAEWLRRLVELNPPRCLMVVGANHVTSFSEKVRKLGHICVVACSKWAATSTKPQTLLQT